MAVADLVLTVRRPSGGARTHRFSRGPVTLGRGWRCDVRLDDSRVSGVHARFIKKKDRWLVLDPGSTTGVDFNGQRLPGNTPRPIRSGDALRLASFVIDVSLDDDGGLTTDSRDTDSVARALLTSARSYGGWGLWVLDGASAGGAADVSAGRTVLIGSSRDCDIVLSDPGVVARHVSVSLSRDGRLMLNAHAGGVTVRGQRVRRAVLWPDDTVRIRGVSLRVRGPATAESSSDGLSFFELLAVLVILGSATAMIWAWWGG